MKKTTKKISLKKILGAAALCFGLSNLAMAQCNASFTYTTTSSGVSATSTSTGTTSTTQYYWTLLNYDQVGSADTVSFSPLYNGTYIMSLTIDSLAGCTNSSQTVAITISGGQNQPSCDGNFTYTTYTTGVTDFTSAMVDPYNSVTYSWAFGDGLYAYGQNPSHQYYYSGTYTVALTVSNMYGCYATTTQTLTVTANGGTIPACNSNFTYTVGATGLVDFTSLYTGTAPTANTVWDFGDGSNSIVANPSYTYPYNGVYNVTLSVSDSASNCASTTTQTISITNAATPPCLPSVSFRLHQDTLNPQPGVWEIGANYSSQVSSARWYWGDGSSTTGLYPTHNYATPGSYTVCVTVYSTCGDSATTCQNDSLYRMMQGYNNTAGASNMIQVSVVNATTGIVQYTNVNANIALYPNPSTGMVNLSISNLSDTKVQISISNILGEVVYNTQEAVSNNALNKTIDLQNMANGAYFMKVIAGGKSYSNKIIINK